jgi:prephenate dehydratase
MPLENTQQGAVIETLDCLLSYLDVFVFPKKELVEKVRHVILGDLALHIRHCLVAKKGVGMSTVDWVRSHEQVCDLH